MSRQSGEIPQLNSSLPALLPDPMPEAAARLLQALEQTQARRHLFPADEGQREAQRASVVVAVSGGVDSVCLLDALWRLADAWRLDLHVAHLDHALREDSREDAARVEALAAAYALPYHSARLSAADLKRGSGLEDAARRARYRFLCDVAERVTPEGQKRIVATAHHRNDQAETVLMRLLAGSGLQGLAAMRWTTDYRCGEARAIRIVRPLLGVTRAELIKYARAVDLVWREDTTNADCTRLRNRIRHEILPALEAINPNVVEGLARSAEILAAEAERAQRWDEQVLDAVTLEDQDRIVLDLDALRRLDEATLRGALRLALARMGVDLREVGFDRIGQVLERIEEPRSGGPYPLVGDVQWTVTGAARGRAARLSLHGAGAAPFEDALPRLPVMESAFRREVDCPGVTELSSGWRLRCEVLSRDDVPQDWRENNHPLRVYVNGDRITRLAVVSPQAGMRFAPFGMGGRRKLLGDFFTDRKVPAAMRAGVPLLVDAESGEIVWVCGYAIAENARIDAQTGRVLKLEWMQDGTGER